MNSEKQMEILYRLLRRDQQADLISEAFRFAMDRYLPDKSVGDFRPACVCGRFLRYKFETQKLDAAERIEEALSRVADIESSILAGDHDDQEVSIVAHDALCRIVANDDLGDKAESAEFIAEFLAAWRDAILAACQQVREQMATTVKEAEVQIVSVPDLVEGWVSFALTLDGDSLSEELDGPEPGGPFDVSLLDAEEDASSVHDGYKPVTLLNRRLHLYLKLRMFQAKGVDLRDLPQHELGELQYALDRLRYMVRTGAE